LTGFSIKKNNQIGLVIVPQKSVEMTDTETSLVLCGLGKASIGLYGINFIGLFLSKIRHLQFYGDISINFLIEVVLLGIKFQPLSVSRVFCFDD
jgi:hypothetical protein